MGESLVNFFGMVRVGMGSGEGVVYIVNNADSANHTEILMSLVKRMSFA